MTLTPLLAQYFCISAAHSGLLASVIPVSRATNDDGLFDADEFVFIGLGALSARLVAGALTF